MKPPRNPQDLAGALVFWPKEVLKYLQNGNLIARELSSIF